MRKSTAIPLLIRHWLKGGFLVLLMGLVATPAVAVLSDKTGQIQGQAPTVTGSLQVLFPDEEAVLSDNGVLGWNQRPNQFRVSSSIVGLVLQDADGDSGLSALVDADHATLRWRHNGIELTPAQLAASFGDNFAGQTLTLEVSAPVTVSSVTGLPTTAGPQVFTNRYTLVVLGSPVDPVMITGVKTNVGTDYGATFAITAGFPKTGFAGAKFQLETSKDASNYYWSSNDNAVVVNSLGEVMINNIPSGIVIITITDKLNSANQITYSFKLATWFIRNDGSEVTASEADSFCAAQPGYDLISFTQITTVLIPDGEGRTVRAPNGRLISEWGNMSFYDSAWEGENKNLGHWARESIGNLRYLVGFGYGVLNVRDPTAFEYKNHVACSRNL